MQLGRKWRGKEGGFPSVLLQKITEGRGGQKGSQREWEVPGALTGVENLGSLLGGPYQLTAKFVHSAVEGFGFLGVPGSCVFIIYRSEMSQDSGKVREIHSQAPGRVGEG